MRDLLFINAAQVVTCAGPDRARKGSEMRDAGILKNAAVGVSGGRIAAIGAARDIEPAFTDPEIIDAKVLDVGSFAMDSRNRDCHGSKLANGASAFGAIAEGALSGSGFPLVSGRNGTVTRPRI